MKKNNPGGIVYSTDKNFRIEDETDQQRVISPSEQVLKIRFETKHRAGKAVTVVDGYAGDATQITKSLKAACGTGGSFKDGQILIQGDHREKVFQWLKKNGYAKVKL